MEGTISTPSLARSTASMSIATTLSRVTGFARDWAMAVAMGATLLTSAYTVSNNVPNMVYELVAGGVLSAVFVPIFIERLQNDGEEAAWRFASSVLTLAVIALGVIAVAGTVWAEAFVRTQTFGVPPQQVEAFVAKGAFLFRFFAVQIVFYAVGAVVTGILNARRRFLAPAVAPIFNNLVLIAVILGVYLPLHTTRPHLAETLLAIGTTAGVVVMLVVQVPSLARLGVRLRPVIDLKDPAMRAMGRTMLATLVYVGTNMVGVSLRNAYSLRGAPGAVGPAIVRYAWMFYQLPYGIFAVALATAFLPELASAAGARDMTTFKRRFATGLGATGVLMLPMAAMLVALARPLVMLLHAGRFTTSDVGSVSAVLTCWAFGLFSFAAYMFTLRAFYALQDTRTPMATNVFATSLQVGLYAVLTVGVGAWKGVGLRGIALADAAAYTLHFGVLWLLLRRKLGPMGGRTVGSSLLRVLACSLVGGAAAWGVSAAAGGFVSGLRLGFLAQLVPAGVVGLSLTYALAHAMRVPEVAEAGRLARRVFSRLLPGGVS
ncbi:MAG: murein biosynthesis integral membrane protein MurJ [Coriobacteriia bacterium]